MWGLRWGMGGGGRGFIEMGGLFNLAKTMVSVLPRAHHGSPQRTRMQSRKAKVKKLEVVELRIKNKTELPAGE